MSAPSAILLNGIDLAASGPHIALTEDPSAGQMIARLTATDADPGDTLTFTLLDDADGLFFLSGNLICRAAGGVLDPGADSYTLSVQVTDASGQSYVSDARIGVADLPNILRTDGTAGNDTLTSESGREYFIATAGNDTIDAGSNDVIVYAGLREDYQLIYTPASGGGGYGGYGGPPPDPATVTVVDLRNGGPDGADLILNPSTLRFADGDLDVSDLETGRPTLTLNGRNLTFDAYVPENEQAGYAIGQLSALGLSSAGAITITGFEVLSFRDVGGFPVAETTTAFFAIDANRQLSTAAPLNFEHYYAHYLQVTFTDPGGSSWTESIRLDVADSADAPVAVSLVHETPGESDVAGFVAEHSNRSGDVQIGRLDFDDTDGSAAGYAVAVSEADAASYYVLDGVLYLRQGALVDFETSPQVSVDLLVRDLDMRADQAVTLTATFDVTFAPLAGTSAAETILGTAGADYILGLAGADTLRGGRGNDTLLGGNGSDQISGGDGNDLIYADHVLPSEGLRWGTQGPSGTDIAGGFVQTIGTVQAMVTVALQGDTATAAVFNGAIFVGLGEPASNGYYASSGEGEGPTSTLTVSFSDAGSDAEVSDVAFRLLDIDAGGFRDIVTVQAFDADGTALAVTMTPNGQDIISGTTVTGAMVINDFPDETGSVLVRIAGPVHSIVIIYENGLSALQTFGVSDIYFNTDRSGAGSQLSGDLGHDTLIGAAFADVLSGGDGDDLLRGNGGNDALTGATGNDTLLGGSGNDALNGGLGNDRIDGGDGIDRAYFTGAAAVSVNLGLTSAQNTGHGLDMLLNVENLTSGDGNDRLIGNALANTLTAGAGNDVLDGGAGNDLLEGGLGHDGLTGGSGNDTLLGGSGNDALNGGLGNDRIDGGDGIDRAYFTGAAAVSVNLGLTSAQNTGHGLDTILNVENLTSGDGNDRLIGNALANTLTAGAGNDVLDGGAGNDLLEGGLGHDGLTGGSGNDTLLGGSGNDALNGGLGNDRIDGGDGIDRAYFTGAAAVSVNLGLTSAQNTGHGLDTILNVENLTSGDGNDRLIGNALANTLTAGAGNDTLNGGAGNDLLEGGTGNDALTGATGNDTLLGGSGNDALNGGLGNDRMTGGAGSDSFVFNTALGAGNSDVIVDFNVTDDSIRLDDAVFQGLALGRLAGPAFAANLTGFAEDASDRIIYETDTGRLYFDADGSGAAARVQFATMTAGLALTTADFFVF